MKRKEKSCSESYSSFLGYVSGWVCVN
jgi:hypothetical protein